MWTGEAETAVVMATQAAPLRPGGYGPEPEPGRWVTLVCAG